VEVDRGSLSNPASAGKLEAVMGVSVRSAASDRRLAVTAVLLALSALVAAMVAVRVAYTETGNYINLAWNLFLAWIPFALALVVYDRSRRAGGKVTLLVLSGLWLLFFPNAPYIVTDFRYLSMIGGVPTWYDVVLVTTAACVGLVLGFISLYLMQVVAARLWGGPVAWLAVAAVLAVSSFGVYLGRVHRWNSWDLFTEPGPLLGQIFGGLADPLDYTRAIAAMVLFTGFLTASYAVFYAIVRASNLLGDQSRSA
jgi:uncharacterized membrane protein